MAQHTSDIATRVSVDALMTRTFAPIQKRALGVAVGVTGALGVFLLTAFHIVVAPAGGPPIGLLSQYFVGYDVDWPGATIGAVWGAVYGFAIGWLLAAVRNLVTGTWLRVAKAKVELSETRDFLDHV